jgi:hypothetical protein
MEKIRKLLSDHQFVMIRLPKSELYLASINLLLFGGQKVNYISPPPIYDLVFER